MINAQQEIYIVAIKVAITLLNESIEKKEKIKRNLMKSSNYVESCNFMKALFGNEAFKNSSK